MYGVILRFGVWRTSRCYWPVGKCDAHTQSLEICDLCWKQNRAKEGQESRAICCFVWGRRGGMPNRSGAMRTVQKDLLQATGVSLARMWWTLCRPQHHWAREVRWWVMVWGCTGGFLFLYHKYEMVVVQWVLGYLEQHNALVPCNFLGDRSFDAADWSSYSPDLT